MTDPRLGVCYYPEHWPQADWPAHAAAMHSLGIGLVRIGEFSWSRLEPSEGRYDWAWLDDALDVLASAGLKVVLCTPTACPPAWLAAKSPDILPLDKTGVARGFGSRRHYSFSSDTYLSECDRITSAMLDRYGKRHEIVGWQIDNEFGCHDTTLSFDPSTLARFRRWLKDRYGSIEALNAAWGTVFWSQTYPDFDAIGFPGTAVTESNPALSLAFQRFASDEVRRFCEHQTKRIRDRCQADVWITHNFMGNFTDFDHFDVATTLDVASWDSYPLGFLQQSWFDESTKDSFRQTGHPDWAAFHHDLYRGVGSGRFGVMEQQPGAVNWADCNAMPLPGMVRLWSWEAIAHGAEFVSYFRWQQFPMAQELMHSALNLPNGEPALVQQEVRKVAEELTSVPFADTGKASVALVFDYASCWMSDLQAHAAGYSAFEQAFSYYSAARSLGLDIDIVSAAADLDGYRVILVPALFTLEEAVVDRLESSAAEIFIGPRSGSRTSDSSIPDNLPPGCLQRAIPLRVVAVDSIRSGSDIPFTYSGDRFDAKHWLERIESDLDPLARTADGHGVYFQHGSFHYLGAATSQSFLQVIIRELCDRADLPTVALDGGLRLRRRGSQVFAFNYGPEVARLPTGHGRLILGAESLRRSDVAMWIDESA